jgi:hypothetical protein
VRIDAAVEALPAVYTCVQQRNTEILTAVDYRAREEEAAIVHLKASCEATPGCTECQLWRAGEKVITYRPEDEKPLS